MRTGFSKPGTTCPPISYILVSQTLKPLETLMAHLHTTNSHLLDQRCIFQAPALSHGTVHANGMTTNFAESFQRMRKVDSVTVWRLKSGASWQCLEKKDDSGGGTPTSRHPS